jgi:signal transduction histidine kinase
MSDANPLSDMLPEEFSVAESIPVLVAVADLPIRRALAKVFTMCGYEVTCAEDGVEALEMTERQKFSLVVADVDMPRKGGVELARALSDRDTFLTCLLLATPDQLESILEAAEFGNVYNHFWKPLTDLGEVARTAARALEHRELRRNNAYLLAELRDAKTEWRALASRLEQLDKVAALGQMTGTVARDMEAPLMSLLSYAQYLRARLEREGSEPLTSQQIERVLEYMREMEHGVQRCYSTVQNVLDYTRVHAEPPGPVALHTVVEETLGLLLHGLQTSNIRVQLNLMPEAPPVLANPRRLQQVLVNLVRNAQQAMGKTGGTLALTTTWAEEAESGHPTGVTVRIADTGSGIAASDMPRIFEPFFTTRAPEECLGVGLTIARNIVHEWKGDIHIASEMGRGTTVTLTLPLCTEMAVSALSLAEVFSATEGGQGGTQRAA